MCGSVVTGQTDSLPVGRWMFTLATSNLGDFRRFERAGLKLVSG